MIRFLMSNQTSTLGSDVERRKQFIVVCQSVEFEKFVQSSMKLLPGKLLHTQGKFLGWPKEQG